jgi:Zn-dependent peptidase ImmA (M78 family)/transcriptional regulator with XRE-family HTH domain
MQNSIAQNINKASYKLMGYRVQAARENKGLTQAQLTKVLGFKNRQTISSIENGERAIKSEELFMLTEALDCNIDFLFNPFSVSGEAKYSWRAAPELTEQELDDFESQTGQWIGLFRWLREIDGQQNNPLKYSLKLTKRSSFEDTIVCAENLVKMLVLGIIPANKLIQQIEEKLDIPILLVDTIETPQNHTISGATCHLQDLSIILINRNEPEARRFYNIAHELFHVLTWDVMQPDYRESNSLSDRTHNKRIEQLADNFAAALLMPEISLKHFINKKDIDNIEHLLAVAKQLKVTPIALAYKLYNLKWIDQNMLNTLKQHKLKVSNQNLLKPFQPNFIHMLHRAIDNGQLSARKAAKAMSMNLLQLTDLFAEYSLAAPFEL